MTEKTGKRIVDIILVISAILCGALLVGMITRTMMETTRLEKETEKLVNEMVDKLEECAHPRDSIEVWYDGCRGVFYINPMDHNEFIYKLNDTITNESFVLNIRMMGWNSPLDSIKEHAMDIHKHSVDMYLRE